MCIVFSIIEHVYWYSRVTLSSMFVGESSYVCFPRSFFLCVHSSHLLLESEMSDLLLGALIHYPFHHYIHCWCDFTPCLIWVDHYSSLYVHYFSIILAIVFYSFPLLHPLILVLQWPIPRLLLFWHHFYTFHYHFDLLYLSHINIIFTLGTELFYTCCILFMRAWVLIIRYLSLVSLRFYYPITLAYVTSRVLRSPWGHGIRCRLQQPLLWQVFEI